MADSRRWLFTLTILAGSFLLFLVQPMVARMALPQLGGAPNVWNSALLVYQALLLGGYAYAHAIGRFSLARQGLIHLVVLLLGALTLPLALADLAPPDRGMEALWVPWLFLLTVGPAFFAVSAQAPLIQRWFAAHPGAGNPYPLYAASNLGSFAGLLTYPLLAEPLLTLGQQSWLWAMGYALLVLLVAFSVISRRGMTEPFGDEDVDAELPHAHERTGWRTIGVWLALSAVPSGLMLSTTTFLTTDIMAMPLLWVIPLGLYLLSYSIAFAARRSTAQTIVFLAPLVLLVDGSLAMFAAGRSDLLAAVASIILLFVVAVALHSRLYDSRPPPAQLTRFYLVTAAGGALGGVFAALVAPVVFDWMWEHPLLILGAAAMLPLGRWSQILGRVTRDRRLGLAILVLSLLVIFLGGLWLFAGSTEGKPLGLAQLAALTAIVLLAILLTARRWAFVAACAALLLSLGGIDNLQASFAGARERSYFGIYSVRDEVDGDRVLMHGTTIHGTQRAAGTHGLEPTAYYGRSSGVGRALAAAPQMFGPRARIGVVGLGVGTLACYRQPGQDWTFFEIDHEILDYSRSGVFTYLADCAPDAEVMIGDARIAIEALAPDSFEVLVIDAFSSDAIPLHLLTDEALAIYQRSISTDGLLLLHISNRYIDLEPVLARLAEQRGLASLMLVDEAHPADELYPSTWVALSSDEAQLARLRETGAWYRLRDPAGPLWTDDYASIVPYLVWENFL